jgi:hypothetical protein
MHGKTTIKIIFSYFTEINHLKGNVCTTSRDTFKIKDFLKNKTPYTNTKVKRR